MLQRSGKVKYPATTTKIHAGNIFGYGMGIAESIGMQHHALDLWK